MNSSRGTSHNRPIFRILVLRGTSRFRILVLRAPSRFKPQRPEQVVPPLLFPTDSKQTCPRSRWFMPMGMDVLHTNNSGTVKYISPCDWWSLLAIDHTRCEYCCCSFQEYCFVDHRFLWSRLSQSASGIGLRSVLPVTCVRLNGS